jgi:hypothetical protein
MEVSFMSEQNRYTPFSKEFASALVKAQGAIEGAVKDKANPAFRSKYADLGACWDACREALQANQIAVLQWPMTPTLPGHIQLMTQLVYGPTGEAVSGACDYPLKDPTNVQAAGSAITYARRYGLCSVLGICPEDDDGSAAASLPSAGKANAKASQSKPSEEAQVNAAGYETRFAACKDNAARKELYKELKASGGSTEQLSRWASVIKENA